MIAVAVLALFVLCIVAVKTLYKKKEGLSEADKKKIAWIRKEVELLESDRNQGKVSTYEYFAYLKKLSGELEEIEVKL